MKKFVLCIMLMMCVASLSAQWSVTPEVGMNVTKYQDQEAKMGFKAGAAVSYTFGSGLFSLQSGLYYVQRGTPEYSYSEIYGTAPGSDGKLVPASFRVYPAHGKYGGGFGFGSYGNGYGYEAGSGGSGEPGKPFPLSIEGMRSYSGSTREDYLQLPVMARFNWKIGNDIRFHVAAGPYIAWGIGGKSKSRVSDFSLIDMTYSNEHSSVNPFKGNLSPRRFDWGATLQAGIEVKRVSLNVGYDLGLGKKYKYDDLEPKYQTFSFAVGYTF